MKRVVLSLVLCVAGGLASIANAGECHGGRCRDGCPTAATGAFDDVGSDRGERCCRRVRRVARARPIRKLFENRPVRRFVFSRCCG
jgi:hypothetical protein